MVLETAVVDTIGPNGSTPKGQIISNLDNSKNYVCSLISESFQVQNDNCAWWVDSGVTSHVCKDRRSFEKLTPIDDGSIDLSTQRIYGIGIVNLSFTSGKNNYFS